MTDIVVLNAVMQMQNKVGTMLYSPINPDPSKYLLLDGSTKLQSAWPQLSSLIASNSTPILGCVSPINSQPPGYLNSFLGTDGNNNWSSADASGRVAISLDNMTTWTIPHNSGFATPYYNTNGNGIAYGNGICVIGLTNQCVAVSSDLINWTIRPIGAIAVANICIRFTNGIFFALSSTGNTYTSTDGYNWTSRAVTAGTSVGYVNGLYLMLANSTTYWTSPDLINWTSRTLPYAFPNGPDSVSNFNSNMLCYNNGLANTYVTIDGINWRTVSSSTGSRQIYYLNGIWIQICSTAILMTTDPTISWTQIYTLPSSSVSCGMSTAGFVISLANGSIATSPDGVNWSINTSNTYSLYGTSMFGGGNTNNVMLVGLGSNIIAIAKSIDNGATWTYYPLNIPIAVSSNKNDHYATIGTFNFYSVYGYPAVLKTDGNTFILKLLPYLSTATQPQSVTCVLLNNGRLIACGSGCIWVSDDNGDTWTLKQTTGGGVQVIAKDSLNLLALGSAVGACYLSTDNGNTWVLKSTGSASTPTSGIYAAGTINLFVVGHANGNIYTSPDGTTWTTRTSNTTVNILKIIYANALLVAVGGLAGANLALCVTSPDGITWTAKVTNALNGLDVIWNGAMFLMTAGFNGTSTCYTSPTGVTFTAAGSMGGTGGYSVNWNAGAGLFIAFGYSTITPFAASILTSPTGVTWTSRTPPFTYISPIAPLPGNFSDINFTNASNKTFICGTILRSSFVTTDGINYYSPYQIPVTSINVTGIAISSTGIIIVISGSGAGIAYRSSDNGLTWTIPTTNTTKVLNSIIWANGQFVAITLSGNIITSPDGITWTLQTSGTIMNLISIFWTGSVYIAAGNGIVLTSPDAITWTSVYSNILTTIYGIVKIGSIVYALGSNNLRIHVMTSDASGAIWTTLTNSSTSASGSLFSITKIGSYLVGLGLTLIQTNLTVYSNDNFITTTLLTFPTYLSTPTLPPRLTKVIDANTAQLLGDGPTENITLPAPITTFTLPNVPATNGSNYYVRAAR